MSGVADPVEVASPESAATGTIPITARSRRIDAGLWLLFVLGVLLQGITLACADYSTAPYGDETYYIARADFLVDHGHLPRADEWQTVLNGARDIGSERPVGLPVMLAGLRLAVGPEHVRAASAALTFLATGAVLAALFARFRRSYPQAAAAAALAVLLTWLPWSWEFCFQMYPDQWVMALFVGGLLLWTAPAAGGPLRWVAALLLGLTLLLRVEMALFVPLALLLLWFRPRRTTSWRAELACVAVALLLPSAVNLGYRHYFDGQWRLYGTPSSVANGLAEWTTTWPADELTRYNRLLWRLDFHQPIDVRQIPPVAYDSSVERRRVAEAISLINSGDLEHGDAQLLALADERRQRAPWSHDVAIRLWAAWTQLVHSNNLNVAHWAALERLPPAAATFAFDLLSAARWGVALATLAGLAAWLRRRPWRDRSDEAYWLAMSVVLIGARIGAIGFLLHSLEHRYAVVVLPLYAWLTVATWCEARRLPAKFAAYSG